jgi:hypothetical protein
MAVTRSHVLLMAGVAAVTLAPSASAAPLPNFSLGIQLADGGCRTELGTAQFANFGSSATRPAGDANNFDPDCARIIRIPAFGGGLLNSNLDFRIGGVAMENNGSERGTRCYSNT